MEELDVFDTFVDKLRHQGLRKCKLYDGSNKELSVDTTLRYALEELGEISSAITRERFELAECECIDAAHTIFLVYLALVRRYD